VKVCSADDMSALLVVAAVNFACTQVAHQLTIKFGKEYAEMCRRNGFETVNEKVKSKVTFRTCGLAMGRGGYSRLAEPGLIPPSATGCARKSSPLQSLADNSSKVEISFVIFCRSIEHLFLSPF